ncbi:hypothetical protein [Nocardia caishijiensis]|uniref:Uncharacterized protein n=1 Tax=Nocardia caishijiensis TaxID=184756 RepID=A0ABQ6YGE2_9NOCA|nr:hypothetical protein [Nocardia caishijiensis]KAF0844776.1 hypothetical protein FNL39_1108 [Nocardia caishijiensis]
MKVPIAVSTVWRLCRIPLILTVVYLALHAVLAASSVRHGYGSPDGLGTGFVTLAVVVVALRLVLIIVVPAVLAYRVVTLILAKIRPASL